MECAICLNAIRREDEAWLIPCWHFFCLKCIQGWTDQQRRHPPGDACPPEQRCVYPCPLCRQRYTHIVTDSIGTSCRLLPMCGAPAASTMPLTAEQSRRRSVYVTPQQFTAHTQLPRAARPRVPSDPHTSSWVARELQAVLLTEDVAVLVQHVLGVLQQLVAAHKGKGSSAGTRPPASGGAEAAASALYGDRQAFVERLSRSMAGFLEQHSSQFAAELWSFLHSGLSIAAFDKQVFGAAPAAAGELEAAPSPAEGGAGAEPPYGGVLHADDVEQQDW